jgi:hypothetical protein
MSTILPFVVVVFSLLILSYWIRLKHHFQIIIYPPTKNIQVRYVCTHTVFIYPKRKLPQPAMFLIFFFSLACTTNKMSNFFFIPHAYISFFHFPAHTNKRSSQSLVAMLCIFGLFNAHQNFSI